MNDKRNELSDDLFDFDLESKSSMIRKAIALKAEDIVKRRCECKDRYSLNELLAEYCSRNNINENECADIDENIFVCYNSGNPDENDDNNNEADEDITASEESDDLIVPKTNDTDSSDEAETFGNEKAFEYNGYGNMTNYADYPYFTEYKKPDGFYKTHKRLINRIILILFAILLAYGVVFYRYIQDGNKKQNEQSYYNSKRYRSYQTRYIPKTATTTATAKKRVYRKTKKTESYDRYNVKEYNNPEDFYDDNYDDFFDYYDAEDYYFDHS